LEKSAFSHSEGTAFTETLLSRALETAYCAESDSSSKAANYGFPAARCAFPAADGETTVLDVQMGPVDPPPPMP